ncbi:S8 family peptidase [Inconstantimicrobium porci]|nr:S8 family peptidase [Inconstantimicrobium porci]MDD6769352.1 S8 family peptidase [Inconstantimicrobium porci]
MNRQACSLFIEQNDVEKYLIEYRGNLLEQMKDIDYACAFKITDKLAILAIKDDRIDELKKAVPAIIFVNFRNKYVLQDTSVTDVSNIQPIKINPYLNLTGRGVIIGIVDTGIDYTNKEFLREDNTSRIEVIWDQTISSPNTTENSNEVFTGTVYDNDKINEAVKAKISGNDPYAIVPSRDEIGHGTQMASIAGARGYDQDVAGVANDCTFAIVKLKESQKFKNQLADEGIQNVPVYSLSVIIAGIEYLKNYSLRAKKPMIILNSIGTSDYSHDSSDVFSRYLSKIASNRGLVFVASCGNEGAAETHASGYLSGADDIKDVELKVGNSMKLLQFRVFVRRPNKMSIAVVSPSGESSQFMSSNLYKEKNVRYIFENTDLKVNFYNPDNITGLQVFLLSFSSIKSGIWKIRLKGEYIVNGRFDIWLPPSVTLKPDIRFLEPDPNQTLTAPGASSDVISVSYYNQEKNSIVPASGRGFPLFPIIKPDIAAPGISIYATSTNGSKVTVTGASAATSIVAGTCALLMQWGIVDGNDSTMYANKILSYLVAGAFRNTTTRYPDYSLGYGTLDLLEIFNSISGLKLESRGIADYTEYYTNNLYVRIPQNMEVRFVEI